MAEDWSLDVKKYVPDADDKVIAAIVRYCGIALQSRDASLVSFSDPVETARVRDNYCRKKLGLTHPDEEVDAMIARVGERMQGDTTRNRVTVYYLLAEAAGKLGLFGAAATASAAAAEPVAAAAIPVAPVEVAPPPPAAPIAAPVAAAPAAALAAAPVLKKDDGGFFGMGLGSLAVIGAVIIGTGLIGSLIGQRVDRSPIAPDPAPAVPVTAPAAVPVVTAPVIPEGAGLVAEEVAGKPRLSVYFDTAKTDVTPDLPNEIGALKAYVDSNPSARLGISGYNDPRGNPAFNAELSKNRAENVAAALRALGFPADRLELVKPADTTDDTTSLVNARRVDIYVLN